MSTPLICTPANAQLFLTWLRERGGIGVWESQDLGDPSASWSCPVNTAEGTPTPSPSWKVGTQPARIITDPAEIVVQAEEEVCRIPIALQRRGMRITLTPGSTRKVWAAVEKAGEGASHTLEDREAIIWRPCGTAVPLLEWAASHLESSN